MGRGYMTKTEKLAQLYKKANACNEELPKELLDKLGLYGQILELIGGLWASAHKDWKLAEATRRSAIAGAFAYGAQLEGIDKPTTDKGREAVAEVSSALARQNEAELEGEALRWKNAYMSTTEQIQILKKKYEHLKEVAKGGI
jgi:hypothetical protein